MSLLSTIASGVSSVLTPAPNSPANGVNAGDVIKSAIVPAAIWFLSNAGAFLPQTGPWIALATFALHLVQLYGPAGPMTVPQGSVVQQLSATVERRPRPYDESGADY